MTNQLLAIDDLSVSFMTDGGEIQAVKGVSLTVERGEVVALVGESGSGKSVTVMSILGLTRADNARITGSIRLDGVEIISASDAELDQIRGARVAMIFQDPMTALNPVQRVDAQIVEQIRAHERVTRQAARSRAIDLLTRVGLPHATERARSYPHEFSGGMRQRVMIAMALSASPSLVIADEPTTALDVTVQAQILAELKELCRDEGAGVLLVTHDLGVVAEVADRVSVMYAGRVVEQAGLDELFYDPQHPYTWGLLGSIARPDLPKQNRLAAIPGGLPSPSSADEGCALIPRCPFAHDACHSLPPLADGSGVAGHLDRCWLPAIEKRRLRGADGMIALTVNGDIQ